MTALSSPLLAARQSPARAKISEQYNNSLHPSGTGCKPGSFDVECSNDFETATVTFSRHEIESQGKSDCTLEFRIVFPRSRNSSTRRTLDATITHTGELDLHSRESASISRDYRVEGAALTSAIDQRPATEYFDNSGRQRFSLRDKLGLTYTTSTGGDGDGEDVFVYRLSSTLELETSRRASNAGWFTERTLVFDIRGRD
ncbi:hypothetical protein QBC35DRAFT_452107 [Podospora australis]|uniref:Uncharacterized protein n=1 Tax=Podospora australis TaxID=1536484 RepID=A0AAN7AI83_9PEZI|nr:hypothetical protein QBC35DRAFT_452107 [Podospora australis]